MEGEVTNNLPKPTGNLPKPLTVAAISIIFIAALAGMAIFLNNNLQGVPNSLEPFIPSVVMLLLYFALVFLDILFSKDFAYVMLVVLLLVGCGFFALGANKEEPLKSILLSFGSGLIGLALGIPFGNNLPKNNVKSNQDLVEDTKETSEKLPSKNEKKVGLINTKTSTKSTKTTSNKSGAKKDDA